MTEMELGRLIWERPRVGGGGSWSPLVDSLHPRPRPHTKVSESCHDGFVEN